MDQLEEGGTLKPTSANTEDFCIKAAKVRSRCLNRFNSKRYTKDVNRCFVELNKALRGLHALKRLDDKNTKDGRDIGEVLDLLDSVLVPNSNTFQGLLSRIPKFLSRLNDDDFFRTKRIRFTPEMTTFKPVFSLTEQTLPSGVYAYCSLGTKVILLLLELAQLDYWGIRFYHGLGYARLAMFIATQLKQQFVSLSDSFDVLHHISCYVVLNALCLLKTEGHYECECTTQIVKASKPCLKLLDVFLEICRPETLTDEVVASTFSNDHKPVFLGKIFVEVTSVNNNLNTENEITCRQIGVFSYYMELAKQKILRSNYAVLNWEGWKETMPGSCLALSVHCFNLLGYTYMKAASLYATACNFCLISVGLDTSDQRGWQDGALEYLAACLETLSSLPNAKTGEHHLELYGYAKVAITVTMLRAIVCTIHTLNPEEKLKHINALRDTRKDRLPKDKLLGEQTREKLIAAVSLIHIYLGNHVHELMSFKNGKYRKKLRASLLEARQTAEELLLSEPNETFCRFLIADLGEHWNVNDNNMKDEALLLEKSLMLLLGMKNIHQAKKWGQKTDFVENVEVHEGVSAGDEETAEGVSDGDEEKAPADKKEGRSYDNHTDSHFLKQSDDEREALDHLLGMTYLKNTRGTSDDLVFSKSSSDAVKMKEKTRMYLKDLFRQVLVNKGVPEPAGPDDPQEEPDADDPRRNHRILYNGDNLRRALVMLRDEFKDESQLLRCHTNICDTIGLRTDYDVHPHLGVNVAPK